VKDVSVSDDERREDPVAPVDQEVVVHVIPQVLQREFTIIVVCMHAFTDDLVKARVKKFEGLPAEIGSAV